MKFNEFSEQTKKELIRNSNAFSSKDSLSNETLTQKIDGLLTIS